MFIVCVLIWLQVAIEPFTLWHAVLRLFLLFYDVSYDEQNLSRTKHSFVVSSYIRAKRDVSVELNYFKPALYSTPTTHLHSRISRHRLKASPLLQFLFVCITKTRLLKYIEYVTTKNW